MAMLGSTLANPARARYGIGGSTPGQRVGSPGGQITGLFGNQQNQNTWGNPGEASQLPSLKASGQGTWGAPKRESFGGTGFGFGRGLQDRPAPSQPMPYTPPGYNPYRPSQQMATPPGVGQQMTGLFQNNQPSPNGIPVQQAQPVPSIPVVSPIIPQIIYGPQMTDQVANMALGAGQRTAAGAGRLMSLPGMSWASPGLASQRAVKAAQAVGEGIRNSEASRLNDATENATGLLQGQSARARDWVNQLGMLSQFSGINSGYEQGRLNALMQGLGARMSGEGGMMQDALGDASDWARLKLRGQQSNYGDLLSILQILSSSQDDVMPWLGAF